MIKIFTAFAVALLFSCNKPPFNLDITYSSAINGTFYDTKSGYLAGLLIVDGKKIGEFPITSSKVRGGFVCFKSGYVEAGYFKVIDNKLYFSRNHLTYSHLPEKSRGTVVNDEFLKQVKWAITGGGLFLLEGEPVKRVGAKENLSSYIVNHKRYSALLLHKDKKTITGIIVRGIKPEELAKSLVGKYSALLRLDGGSSTTYFKNKKKPSWINNCVGVR